MVEVEVICVGDKDYGGTTVADLAGVRDWRDYGDYGDNGI